MQAVLQKLETALKSKYAKLGALAVLAAVLAGAGIWLRPSVTQEVKEIVEEKKKVSEAFRLQGEGYAENREYDTAFQAFRAAIDTAANPDERFAAGFAMGKFLLKRAEEQPNPYAQMARGYLDAVSRMDCEPEEKVDVYRSLITANQLMKEVEAVVETCRTARSVAEDDDEKAEFMLAELDALMKIGEMKDMERAWKDAEPYRELPNWKNKFDMEDAQLKEKILTNDTWYQAWLTQQPRKDPVTLRPALFRKCLGMYDRLAKDDIDLADEALFRAAQVCSTENQFNDARNRVREYFDRSFNSHRADIMLMLVRMARLEGSTKQSEQMISQFMRRFQWYTKAVPEMMAVIEQAEAVGHYQEALYYLEEYLKSAEDVEKKQLLELKAGQLALKLKQYDRAMGHFQASAKSGADDNTVVESMLGQAEVLMQQDKLAEAQTMLLRSLTQYPFDPRRGKSLYQLVDLYSRSKAPVADILLVSTLALELAPNDPGAINILMQLARTYEQLGMYSDAQEKYSKVALLRAVDSTGKVRTANTGAIMEALLGSARCLLNLNDTVRADRLLRELCLNIHAGPVFNEAAYLWAKIAVDAGQLQEARRRMTLIDLASCEPLIKKRVQLELMLFEVADNKRAPETIIEYLKNASEIPPAEQTTYVRRAYDASFARMLASKNYEAIQKFIDSSSGRVKDLPVSTWVMQLASQILKEDGVPAFIQCMDRNLPLLNTIKDADKEGLDGTALIAMARECEKIKTKVNDQMK